LREADDRKGGYMFKCFFGCNVKWDNSIREELWRESRHGLTIKEYIIRVQFGTCIKCGKIYRREL